MDMTIKLTEQGFRRAEFRDVEENECFIQEGTAEKIWLGMEQDTYDDNTNFKRVAVMHLTREQVEALLPALKYFVEHGKLPGLGVFDVAVTKEETNARNDTKK
jgi:hypothetical protein